MSSNLYCYKCILFDSKEQVVHTVLIVAPADADFVWIRGLAFDGFANSMREENQENLITTVAEIRVVSGDPVELEML